MPRFTVGCVPFLNARPLIAYYASPEGREEAEVRLAPPSELADWVLKGEVDVALASSFFALTREDLRFVPGISISSLGPVQSVRLFSKVPFADVRGVALDANSMTSNHLAQIVLERRFGARLASAEARPPDLNAMLEGFDAAVLIGDAGMSADPERRLSVLDLGAAWNEMTGLPFVWALWIYPESEPCEEELEASLLRAKEYGMERLEQVAAAESQRLGWPYAKCLSYVAEVIDYDLTPEHVKGFELYADYCREMGFVSAVSVL